MIPLNKWRRSRGGVLEKLTKGVIINIKLKDKQYNGQNVKDERINNDLQNITQKTTDLARRTE
jgi:hypothetical protein